MYIPEKQPVALEALPTMYDLPSEDPEDSGLPDIFHLWQSEFLSDTCCPPNYPLDRLFSASDLNLYYDSNHLNWYKRPDWFAVLDVSKLYQERELRLSYVVWQEKVSPLVVVELLSPGTEEEDLGLRESPPNKPPTKWQVYEVILKIPYYFVFSGYTNELKYFRLINKRYREQVLTEPRVWIPELELGLGVWFGTYKGVERNWLRWYDANSNWIPNSEDRTERERVEKQAAIQLAERERRAKEAAIQLAEQERRAKEQERQAKEAAMQRADRLAEQLRAMGLNPDEL